MPPHTPPSPLPSSPKVSLSWLPSRLLYVLLVCVFFSSSVLSLPCPSLASPSPSPSPSSPCHILGVSFAPRPSLSCRCCQVQHEMLNSKFSVRFVLDLVYFSHVYCAFRTDIFPPLPPLFPLPLGPFISPSFFSLPLFRLFSLARQTVRVPGVRVRVAAGQVAVAGVAASVPLPAAGHLVKRIF